MNVKIEEFYIQSKTGHMDTCEDNFFINDHFIAVIDGATSVSGRFYNGYTQGQIATHLVREAFEQLTGEETIHQIIDEINRCYERWYRTENMFSVIEETTYLTPAASMGVYSRHFNTIWLIGDCQAYFNGELVQNPKRIDDVFAEVRSILLQGEILRGSNEKDLLEHDIGFEMIKPLIQKQYNFQNSTPDCDLSYPVINGYPIPPELIKTVSIPDGITEIALATDGYPKIGATLNESEHILKDLMERDPLCIRENLATKGLKNGHISFDDRLYVRFSVE